MSYPWYSHPIFMEGFVSFSKQVNDETKAVRYVASAPTKSPYRKNVLATAATLDAVIDAALFNWTKVHIDYREAAHEALIALAK